MGAKRHHSCSEDDLRHYPCHVHRREPSAGGPPRGHARLRSIHHARRVRIGGCFFERRYERTIYPHQRGPTLCPRTGLLQYRPHLCGPKRSWPVERPHRNGGRIPKWRRDLQVIFDRIPQDDGAGWAIRPPSRGRGQYGLRGLLRLAQVQRLHRHQRRSRCPG